MSTESEIINTLVDNNGASNDGVGSNELQLLIVHLENGLAVSISLNVTEITGVADLGVGGTMGQTMGVEVGTGRHASVGVVTELAINMKKKIVKGGKQIDQG